MHAHVPERGKGGGVKLAGSPEEATELASSILGMQLVTPQTGPEGREVRSVLVEEALDIASELYLSVTLDRALGRPIIMASAAGGMDIEEVAATTPEAIVRQPFDPHLGLQPFETRRVVGRLGLTGGTARQAGKLIAAGVHTIYREASGNIHGFANLRQIILSAHDDVMACLDALNMMLAEIGSVAAPEQAAAAE